MSRHKIGMPRKDDPDKGRGLYNKFTVTRSDREAQARHDDCEYFVLDLTHDKLAIPALAAYESAAMQHGYDRLAEDLRLIRARMQAGLV
jgi:hypothetical protein